MWHAPWPGAYRRCPKGRIRQPAQPAWCGVADDKCAAATPGPPSLQALLMILDSPLNKAGKLKALYVHTSKNVLIQVNPQVSRGWCRGWGCRGSGPGRRAAAEALGGGGWREAEGGGAAVERHPAGGCASPPTYLVVRADAHRKRGVLR